jgi:hypothetical protein
MTSVEIYFGGHVCCKTPNYHVPYIFANFEFEVVIMNINGCEFTERSLPHPHLKKKPLSSKITKYLVAILGFTLAKLSVGFLHNVMCLLLEMVTSNTTESPLELVGWLCID